jgi:hypothetical protein
METKIIEIQVKDSATPAINKINKNLEKTDKQVAKTGKTANKSFNGLNNTLGFMPKSIQGVIGGLKALKVALISTGIGALVVAAGSLVTLFISATKKGSEFAKQLSTLRAVSGASNEEMEALSESAKKLGSSTQFTAVEVAQLQTEYAKLGKTTPEILAATEATLDLAASLEVGLAEAATLAGSVVNSFGLQASDTQRVVDVLAKSTSSSSLDFGLLTESLKMAAPIARATGKSIEETAGLLGVLADNGVKGSLAGTGLSKVMSELNKKGLTFEEAYSKVNNSTDKLGVAQELVGEIGAKSLLNLANSEEAIGKLTTTLENSGGAAKAMADIRLDNLEGDTTKLSSAWEGFLLSLEDGDGIFTQISRAFVQGLTAIISKITSAIRTFGAFNAEFEASTAFFKTFKVTFKLVFTSFRLGLLKIKKIISDIPFIGKAIDKKQLDQDVKNIKNTYNQLTAEAVKLQKGAAARRQEGTFMERVANRIKVTENKIVLDKIAKNEKVAADKQAKLDEESQKRRKAAYAKFLAFRNKLEKRQEDFDDKTEEEKLARQKERDLKELDALRASSKKKAEARLLIDKFYSDKLIELEEKRQAVIDKKAEAARLAAEKKAENERLAKEKKDADDLKKFLETKKGLEDQYANSLLSNIEQEQNAVKSKYDNLIQQAIIYGEDTKILEEARQSELQEIEKDFAEQNRQARLKEADSRLEIASQATRAVQSLGDAVFAHRMKNLKEGTKEQLKAAKQQFNFNKALQLGMAVIDTGKAITASLAQSPVAIGPIPNPAGIASLAFAAISGASQIAMIASQKYEAPKKSTTTKSPPSISGGGASASQAPNFNVVGQSGFNQVAGALGSQPPAQAFVVSGDITTAQQLENNTIQQATF